MSRFVLYVVGTAYWVLGWVLLGFAFLALLWREPAFGFLGSAAVGLGFGFALQQLGAAKQEPRRTEALFAVAILWLLVPLLGALPYWFSGAFGFVDALFEAMSGFTTTGATVLTDFGLLSKSLFLWRALTQWFGGVGIILLFIAVLPHLAVAGRQMFFAESTGVQKEKMTPRLKHTAEAVLRVYVALTLGAILAYLVGGMGLYDAVAHALTTIPAGGFSPRGDSFASFSPLAQWMAVVFMFLAGANFMLQFRLLFQRQPRPLLADPEFRAYALAVVAASLALSAYLFWDHDYGLEPALRHAFFQVVSIVTTTGYASVDFARWTVPAQVILVALMFLGGSAGSGAGGIKVVRWRIMLYHIQRELKRTLHPQAVIPLRLGGRPVGEDVLRQVSAFVALYVVTFATGALVVALLEGDLVVAFTASAATLGNIGPGLGAVGPMANFAWMHPFTKLVLTFEMWAGRIELIPVYLLFFRELWRGVLRR